MPLGTEIRTPDLKFDRRTTKCPVTLLGLWEAVRLAVSGRADGDLRGADRLDERFPRDLGTDEFYRQFAAALKSDVEIHLGSESYQVAYDSRAEHRRGKGGQTVSSARLLRGNTAVLAAQQQLSYTTLSDDSDDSTSGRNDELFLIDENDELAMLVYNLLSRSRPNKAR